MYTLGVAERLYTGLHETDAKQLKNDGKSALARTSPLGKYPHNGFINGIDIQLGTTYLNFQMKLNYKLQ